MQNKAVVKQLNWSNIGAREFAITIKAEGSQYISEPHNGMGSPMIMNGSPLIEGVNLVLEFGFEAVNAIKGNEDFMSMANEIRTLRKGIKDSDLAARVRQLLSAIDYGELTDFQAKCVLLVERELKR